MHRWVAAAAGYSVQREGISSALPVADGASTLPADRPGLYRVSAGVPSSQPALLYAVNVADGEAELGRLTAEAIRSRFPAGLAFVVHDPAELPSRRAASNGAVSWTVPLALALLGLLWIETLFANRFYGKRATPGQVGRTEPRP
jgi:hypothetical protein